MRCSRSRLLSPAQEALSKYLSNKTGFPDSWRYNASGRGYPDIAAQSENFLVVQLGLTMPVAGTSCAAPTCGGVFSLLNDARLQAGKSPLGFLNPLIYQVAAENPSAFNDVTEGYNMGCGPSGLGFPAREGFDLSSGWGSPNFGVLKSIVLALP
jgi:tripeptidyl-peptidase-1